MNTRTRALLGAVLGAVLVLFLHPLPRPWLQYGLWKFGASEALETNQSLIRNLEFLPDPDNPAFASQWMLTGAAMINERRLLSTNQLLLLVEVSRANSETDPSNGYWRHCEAVFQRMLGNEDASLRAWRKAGACPNWDDYQTTLLTDAMQAMANESGRKMAWHSAVIYHYRSSDVPRAVWELGSHFLQRDPSVENRLDAIRNGTLVRDRARSAEGGEYGHKLIEAGAVGESSAPIARREATFMRFRFIADLAEAGGNDEAVFVSRTLSENEAWQAYVMPSDRDKTLVQHQIRAVLAGSLAGVLCLTAIASTLGMLSSKWFQRGRFLAAPFTPKWAPYTAVVFGLGMFGLTGLVGPSLWVTIIVAAMAYAPPHSVPHRNLSNWLVGTLHVMGILIMGCFAMLVLQSATPIYSLLSVRSFEGNLSQDVNLLGWLIALTGLAVGVMETYAFKLRARLGDVMRAGFRTLFSSMIFSSLLLAGILTPICLYFDVRTSDVLVKFVYNEPGYYLTVK